MAGSSSWSLLLYKDRRGAAAHRTVQTIFSILGLVYRVRIV